MNPTQTFSYPPLETFQKWLEQGQIWKTKLDPEKLSYVLAQIHCPPIPGALTDLTYILTNRIKLWNAVQGMLSNDSEVESIKQFVSECLNQFRLNFSNSSSHLTFDGRVMKEINASYTLLSFPFHQTRSRKIKNEEIVKDCEHRILESIALLKNAVISSGNLSIESIYLIHFVFSKVAIFDQGKAITWYQLYSHWMSKYPVYGNSISQFFPIESNPEITGKWLSFEQFIIDETISSMERTLQIQFSLQTETYLRNHFVSELIRQDVVYWTTHSTEFEQFQFSISRPSFNILQIIRILSYYRKNSDLNREDLSLLLDLIVQREPGFEPYLINPFPEISDKRLVKQILEKIKFVYYQEGKSSKNEPTNIFYLIPIFILRPELCGELPGWKGKPTSEALYYFMKKIKLID